MPCLLQVNGRTKAARLLRVPAWLERKVERARRLDVQASMLYESRRYEAAADAEAELAELQFDIEDALAEIQSESYDADLEGGDASNEWTLMLDPYRAIRNEMSAAWHHYVTGVPFQGLVLEQDDLLARLRAIVKGYGLRTVATDDDLLSAAEDAYNEVKRLRHRV